jgi:hypothetical protein
MLLLILAIVIALVAWALRLMEQAVKGQEFSLMLGWLSSGFLCRRYDGGLFFDG